MEDTTGTTAPATGPVAVAGHGARVVATLEAMWAAIRARHAELPEVVIVTGAAQRKRRGVIILGHHAPERWITPAGAGLHTAEMFISGELLGAGSRHVLEVMLHEAAHALAHRRGVKDTSAAGNRYHNRRYMAHAAELGLTPPDQPAPTFGWSDTRLPEATAAAYADVLGALDHARVPFLLDVAVDRALGIDPSTRGDQDAAPEQQPDDQHRENPSDPDHRSDDVGDQRHQDGGGGAVPEPPRSGRRFAVACSCQQTPRRLQVTPAMYARGGILCGVCERPFLPVPPPVEDPS